MDYIFVSEDFQPPYKVSTKNYVIKKLTVDDVEKDYQAVMSNKIRLRQIFCENDDWPSDDMTIEENYKDLEEHQLEFEKNEGFAYTILNPEEEFCIGCLYIYPFSHGIYDCRIYYWLIEEASALDNDLRSFIDKWLYSVFSLRNPAYPGRDMSHAEWKLVVEEIKNKKR